MLLSQSEHSWIPPVPEYSDGKRAFWISIFPGEPIIHNKIRLDCDKEECERQIGAFKLISNPRNGEGQFYPPIVSQHPEKLHAIDELSKLMGVADGLRAGDVRELRHCIDDKGRDRLLAACVFHFPDAEKRIASQEIKFFSPGLGPVQLPDGQLLRLVLKELSITPNPHLKTGSSHVLMYDGDSTEVERPKMMTEEEKKALMAEIVESVNSSMETKMADFATKYGLKEPAKPEEKSEEEKSVAAMNDALVIENRRLRFERLTGAKPDSAKAEFALFYAEERSFEEFYNKSAKPEQRTTPSGSEKPVRQELKASDVEAKAYELFDNAEGKFRTLDEARAAVVKRHKIVAG